MLDSRPAAGQTVALGDESPEIGAREEKLPKHLLAKIGRGIEEGFQIGELVPAGDRIEHVWLKVGHRSSPLSVTDPGKQLQPFLLKNVQGFRGLSGHSAKNDPPGAIDVEEVQWLRSR